MVILCLLAIATHLTAYLTINRKIGSGSDEALTDLTFATQITRDWSVAPFIEI